ncbi:MAG: flagellar export protein FliJ [Stellaceae bacterium]
MSGYQNLADFVGKEANRQFVAWRGLMDQCDNAKRKLAQLRQYAERYRQQLQSQLADGLAANSTMVFLGFIGQIESVIAKQERDVARLDLACRQQWQKLVEARRERRMYEILDDRAETEKMAADLRRRERELDELLGKVVKLL